MMRILTKPKPAMIFMLLYSLFWISSCKKEAEPFTNELTLLGTTIYVPLGKEFNLNIQQGNNTYEVVVADSKLFEYEVKKDKPAGRIVFKGLNKGVTTMTVQDRRSHKKVNLTIHVVDPYLFLYVAGGMPNIKFKPNKPYNGTVYNEITAALKQLMPYPQESVLLLRNPKDQHVYQFFKDYKQIQLDKVIESGTFGLSVATKDNEWMSFSKNGQNKPVKYPIYLSGPTIFNALKPFSTTDQLVKLLDVKGSANIEKLATSPIEDWRLMLSMDVSDEFTTKYPDVESVFLYQNLLLMFDNSVVLLPIADQVLNPK